MTLDGFLGFLGLCLAFYALVPPVLRLRIQLHLVTQVVLAVIAFGSVVYLEFFDSLARPCVLAEDYCQYLVFPSNGAFTPQQAAFLVVVAWIVAAWATGAFYRPGIRSLPAMEKIVQALIRDKRFSETLDFVMPNLKMIGMAAARGGRLQSLHDWLAGYETPGLRKRPVIRPGRNAVVQQKSSPMARVSGILRRGLRPAARLVPRGRRHQIAADAILDAMLRSEDLGRFVADTRADLLPDLFALRRQARFEFAEKTMRRLVGDEGSRLHLELERNRNLAGDGYAIPEENTLLAYLFGTIDNARDLQIYRPVGEAVIAAIRTREGYVRRLNGRFEDDGSGYVRDIAFAGIRTFDIMVHEAIRQGGDDTMWLAYLGIFAREIEAVHDEAGGGDPLAEFPTLGARLVYEIIDVLGGWIEAAGTRHHVTEEGALQRRAHPIAEASATALAGSLRTVIMSRQFGDRFKSYMNECALRDIASLGRKGPEAVTRSTLIQAVLSVDGLQDDRAYLEELSRLFATEDHVLKGMVADYWEALQAAVVGAR